MFQQLINFDKIVAGFLAPTDRRNDFLVFQSFESSQLVIVNCNDELSLNYTLLCNSATDKYQFKNTASTKIC